jgi:hypothetical protein
MKLRTKLANSMVAFSVVSNLALVAYGATMAPNPTAFFRTAFPLVLFLGLVGAVGALLDAKFTKKRAKDELLSSTSSDRGGDA